MHTVVLTFTKGFAVTCHESEEQARKRVRNHENNLSLISAAIYGPSGEINCYAEGRGRAVVHKLARV